VNLKGTRHNSTQFPPARESLTGLQRSAQVQAKVERRAIELARKALARPAKGVSPLPAASRLAKTVASANNLTVAEG
jgi:hypothetical protein